MIESIIIVVIKTLFSFLSEDKKESLVTEVEALKARAKSVEESLDHEADTNRKAKEVADAARSEGDSDDVFGVNSEE